MTSFDDLIRQAEDAVASLQRTHARLKTETRRTADVLQAAQDRRAAHPVDAPGPDLDDLLRAHVRTIIGNRSQASIARQLGVTQKHLSQMLTGRATLSLRWADRIVRACGRELVIESRPLKVTAVTTPQIGANA